MITEADILDFANRNSITLVPGRDADEWAKFLSTRNKTCPCIPSRVCPCEESLQEIKTQGHCECWLYCSKSFAEEHGGKKAQKPKQKPQPQKADYVIENPKIKTTIELLNSVKKYYEKGDLATAFEKLSTATEADDCENCKGLLKAEATRVMLVSDMCQSIDGDRCEKEIQSAIVRMNELESFFIEVDKYGKSKPGTPITETKPKEDYRACMKKTLVDQSVIQVAELTPRPKETKFYISSQICSNAVSTIEEGLDKCKKTHPEWFS